jgi:hypothetical protein
MASGSVGEGISFWAAIRISGPVKGRQQLKDVVASIEQILRDNGGRIEHHIRVKDGVVPTFQLTFLPPNQSGGVPQIDQRPKAAGGRAPRKAVKKAAKRK